MVMVKGICAKTDCTAVQTGTCLEAHESLSACPHFNLDEGSITNEENIETIDTIINNASNANPPSSYTNFPTSFAREFHVGTELGTLDAAELMRSRYVHLIAILGAYNVGKTCLLSSLYLMASLGDLQPDFSFAGSLTLQGFEDRARRLRKWPSGVLPDKLSDHTVLADPRSPAFMHLALYEEARGQHIDLLFTDLPGEWTTDLINRADTAKRFSFLERADGIILVIESQRLRSNAERHNEVHRAKLMLERLAHDVSVNKDIPLILLVSQCDRGGIEKPQALSKIDTFAAELGFKTTTIMAAAFSRDPKRIKSGTGVMEAIKVILDYQSVPSTIPEPAQPVSLPRSFARFRLD